MLLPLAGKPLILHTVDRAREARNVSRVVVATDDSRIFEAIRASGSEAVMTSSEHQSGSDRVAEVARDLAEGTIIVNVQGDEPLISPKTIETAVDAMIGDRGADIVTTYEPIESAAEILDPNVVKVVVDETGRALYFSRAPIPFPRDAVNKWGSLEIALAEDKGLLFGFKKHTGLYVYRREYLLEFTGLTPTVLERTEMLEQLRALEHGAVIKAVRAAGRSFGVDTPDDLERVRAIVEAEKGTQELAA
jgi:3-deoxy-manno-octulosonate cytidylyltransferase (CMP-KDO synthetase)